MVTQKQFEKGLASYLDSELMPKIHMESWKQFAVGTVISVSIKRMGLVMERLSENKVMNVLGIMDSDGNIDIDILAEESKRNIPREGLVIPVQLLGDITLHSSDIDALYRAITGESE